MCILYTTTLADLSAVIVHKESGSCIRWLIPGTSQTGLFRLLQKYKHESSLLLLLPLSLACTRDYIKEKITLILVVNGTTYHKRSDSLSTNKFYLIIGFSVLFKYGMWVVTLWDEPSGGHLPRRFGTESKCLKLHYSFLGQIHILFSLEISIFFYWPSNQNLMFITWSV